MGCVYSMLCSLLASAVALSAVASAAAVANVTAGCGREAQRAGGEEEGDIKWETEGKG